MKSFLLLPAAAAVFFCTSCSMLIRQDPPPQPKQQDGKTPPPEASGTKSATAKGTRSLTEKEIAEMSPDELERYMEEKRRKERAKAFSDDLASGKFTEQERRQMRENVSRPMTPEERGSAFPWKSESGTRSESLRDTRTFGR